MAQLSNGAASNINPKLQILSLVASSKGRLKDLGVVCEVAKMSWGRANTASSTGSLTG